METMQAVRSPNEDCISSDESWKVLVLCKNETYLLLLWTWTFRLCKCWTRALPLSYTLSLGNLFFNINEKRKIFQSSVIPQVLDYIQNLNCTTETSKCVPDQFGQQCLSIQSLNTNCYEMGIHRIHREAEASQHKEITNKHLKANGT